ncbi:MAG: hypothetical protein R2827_08915 [Bdellovibrionales bacterium]
MQIYLTGFILLNTALLVGYIIWLGQKAESNRRPSDGYEHQNNPTDWGRHTFLGLFYVNPDDPRGWIPRKNPAMGVTVNFRTKKNVYIFLALLDLVVIGTALLLYFTFC